MQPLDKKRALEMITRVVDEEATPEERLALLAFIKTDTQLLQEYECQKKIKALVRERCKRVKAPDHLRQKIWKLIDSEDDKSFMFLILPAFSFSLVEWMIAASQPCGSCSFCPWLL